MKNSKVTVTILEVSRSGKAYKVQADDGFVFWTQRRKNPATEGQIEITAAALEKARQERADFVMEKKVERARAATVITLPAADWEGPCKWDSTKACAGFDLHDCYLGPGRDRQRLRVFLTLNADRTATIAEVERAIDKALERVNAIDVVLGTGALIAAINA